MKRRYSIPAKVLILIGVAAQLLAALALAGVDPVLEYVIPAPDVRRIEASEGQSARTETGLEALVEAREDVEAQLGESVSALSVSGMKGGAVVSGGGKTAAAALCGVDVRWMETCPRRIAQGRWMDSGELLRGARVVVLDEDLAFALFGSEGAEGKEIEIEGIRCAVIGTLRHRRSPGEADEYAAYIPLAAAAEAGMQLDIMTMHALSAVSSGLDQSFTEAMRAAWGAGELHNLRRERMGALLLTRLLLFAFGMAALFRLFRGFRVLVRRWQKQVAQLQAREYARRWLGPAVLRVLVGVLGGALLIAGAYVLLGFAIEPVYTFTEWVPESLVSLSALRNVFWDRAGSAARLIVLRTPESARIAFWGTLARTGAASLLLGLALGRRKFPALPESGNQSHKGGVQESVI